jgi:hypothetical protein
MTMSISSQSTQQKFPFAYDNVFDGVVASIPKIGFSLKSQDRVIGRITASTGMSIFSWGENITIIVEKIDEKNALVAIESAMKLGMNVAGVHRHAHNFEKLIKAVSSYVQIHKQVESGIADAVASEKAVSSYVQTQRQLPKSTPVPTAAELSIPCPLCGKHLKVSTLKRGENWCSYCFEKFIAE